MEGTEMWYVVDKTYGIVVGSAENRVDAYNCRKEMKFLHPTRKFVIRRFAW